MNSIGMQDSLYEQLALALFRVTEHMPPEEPLRMRIREVCLSVAESSDKDSKESLEFLDCLLSIAQKQEWGIDSNNFAVLRVEFSRLTKDKPQPKADQPSAEVEEKQPSIEEVVEPQVEEIKKPAPKIPNNLSARQKNLLDFIKNNDAAQIKNLQHLFPDLSPRTIRRDLDNLVKSNILKKSGKTNGTSYTLIRT